MGKDFALFGIWGCSPYLQVYCVTEHQMGCHVADEMLFVVQSKGVSTSCTTLKTGPGKANTGLFLQGYSTVNPPCRVCTGCP